jgi:protein-tyrosine phosphatase
MCSTRSISLIVPPELLETILREVMPSLPTRLVETSASLTTPAKARGSDAPAASQPAAAEEVSITPELHCKQQRDGLRLIRCRPSVDLCEKALEAETEAVQHAQAAARANGGVFPKDYEREPVAPHEPSTSAATDGRPGPRAIGNLLLSSCPGKKVRLTGPVRGRGAICRDLGLDLKRIHSLGVGAVVCCLDDEELAYLGAPWETYEREADQLGMDVVRLPMAEGFAPTCVKTIDMIITSLVAEYTLQGRHILVHCRGGVGRAGLIACTWMYKLGLVRTGTLPYEQCPFELRPEYSAEHLAAVDRLVQTVRRRRSPKAIETAEQVAFLYEVSMASRLRRASR